MIGTRLSALLVSCDHDLATDIFRTSAANDARQHFHKCKVDDVCKCF